MTKQATPRKTPVSGAATAALATSDKKPQRRPQPLEAASLPDALLKIQTAATVTGLSPSTIFRKLVADPPQFPEPVRMGARCTRWRAASVRDWMAAQRSEPVPASTPTSKAKPAKSALAAWQAAIAG